MNISQVIRKHRKEQNLTQEQVANYLGVTAPAVNKWENGISYPDITLLAPLARVLKTDVDTLLSFHEELTDLEINQFIKEISSEVLKKGYEKTFEKADAKIKEYPNCDKLILFTAQIMNGYMVMGMEDIAGKEKYQKQILGWFQTVAESTDKELANMAVMSLSQNYITNGEYQKAQELLDQIPPLGFDKRMTQAKLYRHQGQRDKAYEVYETMLYQDSNRVVGDLMQIITMLCEDAEFDTALEFADIAEKVADRFELGTYIGKSSRLMIYAKEKKVEETLQVLEDVTAGMDTMDFGKKSKLYRHMKFKDDDGSKEMKTFIKRSLEMDEDLEFLRDTNAFKRIVNRLER